MVTPTSSSVQNYMEVPFIHVPLNEEGRIVTQAHALVKISYKELKTATSTLGSMAYKVMDYFRSISLGCCCCRHRSFTVVKEIELDPLNPNANLYRKIQELQINHPLDFRFIILAKYTDASPPPETTLSVMSFTRQIQSLFSQKKIESQPDDIRRILMAREIALRVRELNEGSIVCIPSNSDFFRRINQRRGQEISTIPSSGQPPTSRSLASVRVYPNGSSSLTFPLLERLGGAIKILNQEVYIAPDVTISLMRRVKLRKDRRESFAERTIQIIRKVAKFTHPGILVPRLLYLHPKKGLEYLVEECEGDLFNLFFPYTILQSKMVDFQNPMVTHILHTPIDTQIRKYLSYMKSTVLALQYMHRENLLHNDLKPENILVKNEENPALTDFDFSTSLEEGLSSHWDMSTKEYIAKNTYYRNLTTELFALARTFWIEDPTLRMKKPSFMDVFEVLHSLSLTKNPELTPNIELVIRTLKTLCTSMRDGTSVAHGKIFPTLDTIIATIEELEGKFLVG